MCRSANPSIRAGATAPAGTRRALRTLGMQTRAREHRYLPFSDGRQGAQNLGRTLPTQTKQNKTKQNKIKQTRKQKNTDRVERTFRSAPVGTGVTEWYRKGSDRRDGGGARFSPHPHGRASTARPLYGGRGAAILPVRALLLAGPRETRERERERWGGFSLG